MSTFKIFIFFTTKSYKIETKNNQAFVSIDDSKQEFEKNKGVVRPFSVTSKEMGSIPTSDKNEIFNR